jgi:hypothetical protein
MQCTILGNTPRLDARNLRKMVGLINRGTTELVQHFPCKGSSHRRKRTLLDINLIWFGYITRLSQWGRGGYFTCSNDFYLPSLRLEDVGGGSAPCAVHADLINLSIFYGCYIYIYGSDINKSCKRLVTECTSLRR